MKVLAAAVLVGLLWSAPSSADQWLVVGSRIEPVHGAPDLCFVMLTGSSDSPPAEIDARYSVSGLYRTGDPNHPLWTVDWWAPYVTLLRIEDNVYLVRLPEHHPGKINPDLRAVTFYRNGALLREYRIRELNSDRFGESLSLFRWAAGNELDPDRGTLTIDTLNDRRYTFDIRTGAIIDNQYRKCPLPGGADYPPKPGPPVTNPLAELLLDRQVLAGLVAILGLLWLRSNLVQRRIRKARSAKLS